MIGYADPIWRGNGLCYGRRTLATIETDAQWPNMWRVRIGDHLTDMVNLTRARDAARCLALGVLNTRERWPAAPLIRYFERPVSIGLST